MAVFLVFALLVWNSFVAGLPQNITTLLASHERFNDMNILLSTTGVAEEINALPAATVFVPEPSPLLQSLVVMPRYDTAMQWLTDISRFHVSRHLVNFSHMVNHTAQVHTLFSGHSFVVEEDEDGDMSIFSSPNTNLSDTLTPMILDTIFLPNITIYTIDLVMIPYALKSGFSVSSSISPWYLLSMTMFLLLL